VNCYAYVSFLRKGVLCLHSHRETNVWALLANEWSSENCPLLRQKESITLSIGLSGTPHRMAS